MIGRNADLAADLAGDDVVVAGEDLDLYARVRQRGDRDAGGFLGGSRNAI